ncbi:MAG: hypothetical protein HQ567_11015 [Candidatus Nealsonbacteria bacterium]|nr:hypothetical protein [Candidatus Nealsonbacteria bacterium]
MKITTITAHIGRKITHQFNSFDNSVTLTAEVEPGDDPKQVVRRLQLECNRLLIKKDPTASPPKA